MVSTNSHQNSVKTDGFSSVEWLIDQAVKNHKEGKIEEAIAFYLETIELDENQAPWIYGNSITLMALTNRFDEGEKLGKKALNIHASSDEINLAIGLVFDKQNNISNSIQKFQKAISINAEQPEWLYYKLAKRQSEIGEFGKSATTCQQGIKIHKNYYPLYYLLGETFSRQGNWEKAICYFQDVEKLNPNYQELEARLNFAFYKKNKLANYKPKISAIVPNYNHGKYLRERLDSILNQTYDNFELLILDDCSSDDSRKIIEEYQKLYPAKIKVFLNQENSGSVFKQWKKGLSYADGSLIWICESDDSCESNFLETLVGLFADPSVMIAFGRIQFIDQNSVEFQGLDEYREKAAPGIWEQTYIETAHYWFNNGLGISNLIANVGGCLFRSQELSESVWQEAQGFKACADWYLYVNLAGGGRIAYSPLAKSYFRQHGKNTSVSNYVSEKYYDEHYRVAKFLKNYHGIDDTTLFNFYLRIADHYKHSFKVKKADGLKPLLKVNSLIHEQKTYKHIAIAFLGFYLGGGEIFPINLANQLVSMGYVVSIWALDHENEVEQIRSQLNPKIPIYYKYLIQEIGVENFLDKSGVDIIHSHNPGWEYFFADSKTAIEMPYVVTHHGGYEVANIEEHHLIKFLKLVNHWVYIADKNLDIFDELPLNSSIFSKLPNAVPYSEEKFAFTREELGIKNDDFVFGIASRALKMKGWEEAIQALIIAQEKTEKNLYLLLCGDGEEKERLEKIYNLANVKFLGYQKNIHGFYQMCDCCLLPTRFVGESFPLSLIESIQSGTPIIATDVGEIKNILIEEGLKVGELIPYEINDKQFINNLVLAIKKMLNQDHYHFLINCMKSINYQYDIEDVTNNYVDIYEKYYE